jgi:hypothetical protein
MHNSIRFIVIKISVVYSMINYFMQTYKYENKISIYLENILLCILADM